MRARLLAEARVPERSDVWRTPSPGWLVHVPRVELIALGDDLSPRARFPLRGEWRATNAVTPDFRHAVISERDRVRLVDATGRTEWEVRHHPWGAGGSESGSCWAPLAGGHVWATVPTPDGPDAWWVLDLATGRRLAEARLSCRAAGSQPVPHPDGTRVGLSVGEGQDGAELYWGRWAGDRALVERLDSRTRCLADVRPDGAQYLTTPHGSGTGDLCVHDLETGRVVGSRSAESTFGTEDWFDFLAAYVAPDLVLAASGEARTHVALPADLSTFAEVEYPAGAAREMILPAGTGRWSTLDYLEGRLQLWALA